MEDIKEKCLKALSELSIPYEKADHEAAFTMEACAEAERLLGGKVCKNLFLTNRQETDFYLLLTPGDKPFKTKFLSKQLGTARLSFAGEEYMEKFLNTTPGSASVLGLMFDTERKVRLIMDKEIYESEYICCHPCKNTSTLKIKTADILTKFLPFTKHEPTVVELPWEE